MAKKTECIAMLLAGGQGSRLGVLTKNIAKPAVPYGGKYRIIDFPLSNCVNSGIYTVGVLTQYQPLELNDYIGNGGPWDLDRANGGVHILSPYQQIKGTEWYKGTANAIYQNINFIDRYNPEYVAVLSGDHIYKMDYAKMLQFHKEKNAACTIAMLEVPWEEASRFGLMFTDDDGRITAFEEKPKNPKSNKASMGVYMFTWEKLRQYLIDDENDPGSSNDFGKNVIPAMHEAGERLFAYEFDGYWKDVGTIDSLWEANLDLLNKKANIDLSDPSWKIYGRGTISAPQYISDKATVENSIVAEGCEIEGDIDYSVLFSDVKVEEGANVHYSIVMPGAVIKKGAVVQYAMVAENSVIEEGAVIGENPEKCNNLEDWGVSVVGANVTVGKDAKVKAKSMIAEDVEGGASV
ncbi:MAG: glucose-1-phosphate adenylyltransferase [Oscillospiraceae bacterium]|nr:glucose-1-phosphate adenylyltransferase [Oscillospiraceae bacterium]MDD7469983.1 glucose-1-phosphate adenylyltransferase [Oscillospiraceae bacterium]MDY2678337.1 glucose-1-phosphate adenylyltransferase [Oscillospiraceae bacterium]